MLRYLYRRGSERLSCSLWVGQLVSNRAGPPPGCPCPDSGLSPGQTQMPAGDQARGASGLGMGLWGWQAEGPGQTQMGQ